MVVVVVAEGALGCVGEVDSEVDHQEEVGLVVVEVDLVVRQGEDTECHRVDLEWEQDRQEVTEEAQGDLEAHRRWGE